MVCLINIPVKKGYEVDLIKPLKNLIESYYSSSDNEQVDVSVPIEQLNRLRQSCVSRNLDIKNETSLELYQKYYDYIASLESKCPPNEIQIPFKWKNAFDRSSGFLLASGALTVSNIRYEKICVLFNIAAIATQVSNLLRDNMKSDSFLKNSAKNYQLASGIFQGLRHLVGTVGQDLTWDLNPDTLNELSVIMLAQAQETFFFKATNDKKAPSIIARICKRCHELYTEAAANLDALNSEKEVFGPIISMKQSAFAGLTEYFQSQVCGEMKKVGEEISRLDKAVEFLKDAEFKASANFSASTFAQYLEKAKSFQDEKRKENDFIYHAIIPSYSSLAQVERVEIARSTPIPTKFLQNPDPFANLLPLSVQQAITKLDLRKGELVNTSTNQLREALKNMNADLTAMNLPASIEDNNSNRLPASLLTKSQTIKNAGGYLALEAKLNKIPELLQRNREIINEIKTAIHDEEETDKRLRNQHGNNKFPFVESSQLNTYWKEQVDKYNKLIENASKADQTVRAKLEGHKKYILLLSKSEREINDNLPGCAHGSNENSGSESANSLRPLMLEVEEMKREAQMIEDDLKNQTFDDMKTKFMDALASDGAINEEALSVESLGEVYGPVNKRLREWLRKEVDLMAKIKIAYNERKTRTNSDRERDEFLTSLANAYNNFEEITQNIDEGTNFYNDLTKLLINLQNKVNDYVFARKTEREELIDYLEKNDSSSTSQPSSTTANRPPTSTPSNPPSNTSSIPPQNTNNPYQSPPPNMPFATSPYPPQPFAFPNMPYYGPYNNPYNYPPQSQGYFPGQHNPPSYPVQPNYPNYNPQNYNPQNYQPPK